MARCVGYNTDDILGLIGIGVNGLKAVEDFKYIFSDRLKLGNAVIWKNGTGSFKREYDRYICCTYERDLAVDQLRENELIYQKDYLFAEDFFDLLDDWKGHRIAYKSYPGSIKGWIRTIIFVYAAKHGKILLNDRHRDVLKGHYNTDEKSSSERQRKNGKMLRWLIYAYYLFLGSFELLPQLFTRGKQYGSYDHICFSEASDAVRYREAYPSAGSRVITVDELRAHTMASAYFRAVYFDQRQNSCGCDTPFHVLWAGSRGMTRLCDCPEFLDIDCGRMGISEPDQIWGSPLAKIIRLSVINHTYTFCSETLCGKMKGKWINKEMLPRMENKETKDHPQTIIVGNDRVCNLCCPSCRNSVYVKNNTAEEAVNAAGTQSLLKSGWLERADDLILGSSGETFLSKYYKQILYDGIGKRNSIFIMTNGILFTPQEWEKLEGKYERIGFSVSVDAANRETYEKLRRGGNFDRLMKNMEFLSALRKSGKVDFVTVNMIVQNANYKEIPEFIRWAKSKGFDRVSLSHIRNWGTFTDAEFESNISMFDRKGKMKTVLAKVLEDPICSDPIVSASWEG